MTYWQTTRFRIDLNRPKIMGIVNLTPDSFSDGGRYSHSLQAALKHAETLLKDGADILDIGGESTRPGSAHISEREEWLRIKDVLAEVSRWQVPVSVDTRRSAVMREVLEHGFADIINDVQGLEDNGAVELLAQSPDTGICLMHMQGQPQTMQQHPEYRDVVAEVGAYLQRRSQICIDAGIAPERITLDPGFGFGKTLEHNCLLMQNLHHLCRPNRLPLLIGVSRKRMIGEITGRDIAAERVSGSVAAALFAVRQGAAVIRVHDVRETADALKVWLRLNTSQAA